MNIALFGSTGFIGTAVRAAIGDAHSVSQLDARLGADELIGSIRGHDVVINCAGAARPLGAESELTEANVELPKRLAAAAAQAQVARFVHVSSAAVQGSREVLDESSETEPLSAYARSKADAEIGLQGPWERPDCTVIYRPASVLGDDRGLTRTIVRLFGGPVAPVFGPGSLPLPTALVESCAEAIALLAVSASTSGVALHPWDGTTQRRLAESLSRPDARLVQLPRSPAIARRLGNALPGRVSALWRRAELLLYGQRQQADYLEGLGFDAHVSYDAYRALRDRVAGS